jgi:hypothetical protein
MLTAWSPAVVLFWEALSFGRWGLVGGSTPHAPAAMIFCLATELETVELIIMD